MYINFKDSISILDNIGHKKNPYKIFFLFYIGQHYFFCTTCISNCYSSPPPPPPIKKTKTNQKNNIHRNFKLSRGVLGALTMDWVVAPWAKMPNLYKSIQSLRDCKSRRLHNLAEVTTIFLMLFFNYYPS